MGERRRKGRAVGIDSLDAVKRIASSSSALARDRRLIDIFNQRVAEVLIERGVDVTVDVDGHVSKIDTFASDAL